MAGNFRTLTNDPINRCFAQGIVNRQEIFQDLYTDAIIQFCRKANK